MLSKTQQYEKICELNANVKLTSPIEVNSVLYLVASNGDVYSYKDTELKREFQLGGNPQGIAIDLVGKNLFVADLAHQAIIAISLDQRELEMPEIMKHFEETPLLGPNSIICSSKQSLNQNLLFFQKDYLYFTDSGPFCESSIENRKGSVFLIDLNQLGFIRPIALNCLAYPSGLALAEDDTILYVCETCENRILKFILSNQGIYYFNVFVQFSGRFGPMSCDLSNSNLLYVARYEFSSLTQTGLISIVNSSGQIINDIMIDGFPEITGIAFSQERPDILYITENSNQPCCLTVQASYEVKDEEEEEKQKQKIVI